MNELIQYVIAHQDKLAEIALGVIFLARMIAALTPSKKDDEVAGKVELGFRRAVEMLSGAGQQNLVVPTQVDPAVPVQVATVGDPFESFSKLVDRFGGKIQIVSKEDK